MKSFRRSSLFALGLLASGSGMAYVAHEAASALAAREVRGVIARMPGVTADAVSVDVWTGRVVVSGISAGNARIGRLTLDAPETRLLPAFVAPAFALDGSATAEDVTVDAGFVKYKAKKIEAAGTALSSSELAAIFDTSSPASAIDRLARLTAASITAPEVTSEIDIGGQHQTVTFHNVKFVDVVKGKVGAFSVGGWQQTAAMPDGETMHITTGAYTGKNMDLLATARFMTATRSDDSEPFAVLNESVSLEGYDIRLDKAGVAFKIGSMSGRDFKARPMKMPFYALFKMLSEISEKQKSGQKDDIDAAMATRLISAALDVFGSFEIGLIEARDIAISMPGDSKVKSVKFGRFGMANFGNGRLGEYSFEGFELDAPDGHAKLGQFALRGFNFKNALDAVQKQLDEGLDSFAGADPRQFIPTLDQIVFSGMDLDVPDDKGKGNSADGKRITMALGKFEIDGANYLGGIPTSLNAAIDNFTFDIANSKDVQLKDFIAMGYKKFDLSAKLDLAWNEAAQTLSVRQLTGKSAGMGTLTLKGNIANVPKELFTGDQTSIVAAALGAAITDADLRFENTGIVEKALEQQAKQQKKTLEQLKKEAVGVAAVGIPGLLKDVPAAKEIANAVAKFIAQPKSFHIAAKSADGIGAGDLSLLDKPAELMKKIALVATAND